MWTEIVIQILNIIKRPQELNNDYFMNIKLNLFKLLKPIALTSNNLIITIFWAKTAFSQLS